MGNRAIVKPVGKSIGVYLHWNGGIDSVTAFLKYCELREFRSFEDAYGLARFCQVVGNWVGGGLSIGIDTNVRETTSYAEGLDNGIYVVKGWEIVRQIGGSYGREGYDLDEFLKDIDEKQPESERLGEFLDGIEMPVSDIIVGDQVFIRMVKGNFEKHVVIGIGEDEMINGRNVLGIPYVDHYGNGKDNINNYILKPSRIVKRVEGFYFYNYKY